MLKLLPGSTIEADVSRKGAADALLTPMFLGGGLMLSQVSQLSGLEPHVIQNWVKRGFLTPPVKKRYSRRQLCRILTINTLRDTLSLERACSLLSYINGQLNDESDDTIDDAQLYLLICEVAGRLELTHLTDRNAIAQLCAEILHDYREPFAGARRRVETALRVITTAYMAAQLKQEAERLLAHLE